MQQQHSTAAAAAAAGAAGGREVGGARPRARQPVTKAAPGGGTGTVTVTADCQSRLALLCPDSSMSSSVIGWYLRWPCCPRPRTAAAAGPALEPLPGKQSLPADWAARLASAAPQEKQIHTWSMEPRMEPRLTEPWATTNGNGSGNGSESPWASSLGLRGHRIWLPSAETRPSSEPTVGNGRLTGDEATDHHLEVCAHGRYAGARSSPDLRYRDGAKGRR